MRQLLDYAAEHSFDMPAFNVNNMLPVQAIIQAVDATDSSVIMLAFTGAREYAGELFLRHLILAAIDLYPIFQRLSIKIMALHHIFVPD